MHVDRGEAVKVTAHSPLSSLLMFSDSAEWVRPHTASKPLQTATGDTLKVAPLVFFFFKKSFRL